MRLNAFTDYSLRLLMFVATAPEGHATIAEAAKAFGISENHLVKVAHFLGREGFLVTTRGRGGGLRLARPAREIGVGALVRACEGEPAPVQCLVPGGDRCAIESACGLAGVMARAMSAFHRTLDAASLEDIAARRAALTLVLHGPSRQRGPRAPHPGRGAGSVDV